MNTEVSRPGSFHPLAWQPPGTTSCLGQGGAVGTSSICLYRDGDHLTVLRLTALEFERKRFHAAYANVRGKDDPAKARNGTAIAHAGMLTVVRRGFACGSGNTGNARSQTPPGRSARASARPAGLAAWLTIGQINVGSAN